MRDIRVVVADEVVVVGRGEVNVDDGIFFIGQASATTTAMKSDEDAVVQGPAKDAREGPVQTVFTVFEQRYGTPAPRNDFLTTFGEWRQRNCHMRLRR